MGEAILGMPGPWAEDYREPADHYTTKIGGLPDWPIEGISIRSDLLQCGGCGSSLCLIMQLYAPISRDTLKIEERMIYVFGCVVPKCGVDPLSWRAVRVQNSYKLEESTSTVHEDVPPAASSGSVSKSDGLDVDSWINDSGDDEDVDLEELGRALSEAACLASHSKKQSGHKRPTSIAKGSPVRPLASQHDANKPVLPCFYIYAQQESTSGGINAVCANYSSLSIKENQSSIDEPKEQEAWEEEGYEYDRALFVDRTFLKFKKRMDTYPEQCFRYSYSGKPLLAAREFEEPKNCGLCGEPRHYEVQLMPPLLFFLREASDGLSAQSLEEWNWMTLIVYTCSKNCSSSDNWTVAEEAVVVQFEKPLHGSARLSYLS